MNKKKRFIEAGHKYLMYTLSLPERTIYNVSFGMLQRFIVKKVAGIDNELYQSF